MNFRGIVALLILITIAPTAYAAITTLDLSMEQTERFADFEPKSGGEKFFELRDDIADKSGAYVAFMTHYDQTLALNSSKNTGNGRALWFYSLAIEQEIWPDGDISFELRGDAGKGMDGLLPTFSLFNGNYPPYSTMYIPRLFFKQHLLDDRLYFALGKGDLSDWFDSNEPADSQDDEFVSYSLVHNVTIPFPKFGAFMMAGVQPLDWIYAQTGFSDAGATGIDGKANGLFKTPFFINEINFMPEVASRRGNYRVTFWMNFDKKDCLDGDGNKPSSAGLGLSFDQELTEKITAFFRYGITDKKVWEVDSAWSTGFEITDPLPGRKLDVFGLGVSQSITGMDFRKNTEDYKVASTETMLEAYYKIAVHRLLYMTPHMQVVIQPEADGKAKCDVVAGVRLVSCF